MPAWIHDRAERLKPKMQKQYGKKRGEQIAFATATQMAHRLGKSPRKHMSRATGEKETFGTTEARRASKVKFDKPSKEYKKTAALNRLKHLRKLSAAGPPRVAPLRMSPPRAAPPWAGPPRAASPRVAPPRVSPNRGTAPSRRYSKFRADSPRVSRGTIPPRGNMRSRTVGRTYKRVPKTMGLSGRIKDTARKAAKGLGSVSKRVSPLAKDVSKAALVGAGSAGGAYAMPGVVERLRAGGFRGLLPSRAQEQAAQSLLDNPKVLKGLRWGGAGLGALALGGLGHQLAHSVGLTDTGPGDVIADALIPGAKKYSHDKDGTRRLLGLPAYVPRHYLEKAAANMAGKLEDNEDTVLRGEPQMFGPEASIVPQNTLDTSVPIQKHVDSSNERNDELLKSLFKNYSREQRLR